MHQTTDVTCRCVTCKFGRAVKKKMKFDAESEKFSSCKER